MLSIGFDPAFVDTIVRAEDENGDLIDVLPQPGYHHRMNTISRVAGGNAVNVAYVLSKLGIKFNLVIPSDDLFDTLLDQKDLSPAYRIHETVNETVALLWGLGEIQFNQVIGKISHEHFTQEIYEYWQNSDIQVSVNWGLNYSSTTWLSCLWLTSCGWDYEKIKELNQQNLIEAATHETNLQFPFVLEPGSVKNHPKKEILYDLLETISQSKFGDKYPIFSCNEEEDLEYSSYTFTSKLIHTSQNVTAYQNNSKQIIEVPKIDNIKTLVGAGDSFLAGIVYQLYKNNRIDASFAISVAQQYMTNTL